VIRYHLSYECSNIANRSWLVPVANWTWDGTLCGACSEDST
jgi:hypothetical protein